MVDAGHSESLRDLHEHRSVIDEDSSRRNSLGKVDGEPEDLDIGLSHANKTGRDECVRQLVECEGLYAMGIHRSRLVADDDHLQAALRFELGGQSKHLWIGLRLSKHEVAKLVARKGTLFKEPTQSRYSSNDSLPS